jgi:hypothetical protein
MQKSQVLEILKLEKHFQVVSQQDVSQGGRFSKDLF